MEKGILPAMLSMYMRKNVIRIWHNGNRCLNNRRTKISLKYTNHYHQHKNQINTFAKKNNNIHFANNSCKLSSNINVKKKTMFIGVSSMFTCVATCKLLGLSPLSINASGATVATTDNILESDTNINNNNNDNNNKLDENSKTVIVVDEFKIKDVLRVFELFLIFSPTIFLFPILIWREDTRELLNTIFIWCIQKAGPTFIKLGQWASTRPDLFPPKTCSMLSILHSNVNPEPFYHVKKQIEESIGLPISEIFTEFNSKPIGCGCVAQVYKGVLKLNDDVNKKGQVVAIKVLRHDIREAFERDLRLMRSFVKGLKMAIPWMKWLEITEAVDLFSNHMTNQLDLRVEANNLKRFRYNFGLLDGGSDDNDVHLLNNKRKNVHFPKPILSYEHVLVQSFEHGDPVLSVLDEESYRKNVNYSKNVSGSSGSSSSSSSSTNQQHVINKIKLANIGVKAFLKMVLIDNFVHGDLHPGNILVRYGDNNDSNLVFLDAGLVVELTDRDRTNFLRVFKAVAEKNGRLVGQLMLEQAKYENCPDHEKFISGMEKIVNVVDTFNLDEIEIGTVLRDVLNLVRENQVQVDSSFTTLVLSIILLEGLGRQLNPKLDIFKAALPMLIKLQLERVF